jgi:DNA polymerase I
MYLKYILKEEHKDSITLEHKFQLVINNLAIVGFNLNVKKASSLLTRVKDELDVLDKDILKEFPPKEILIREFTPKATKFGTISRTSVPRSLHEEIGNYEVGKTYRHTKLVDFNPSSHKQIISVLNDAGWSPTDKTQTHIETERELNRLRYQRKGANELDIETLRVKLKTLEKTGWKVNETNLATLPSSAPSPARALAKRILLESRRRTLTEWLAIAQDDGRIHGRFQGIGAWTHRMAHQAPNTANIPTEAKLYGNEMRALWCAPKNRLLVGVDAEGIQLRIFAHYIDDPEFTKALVEGKKSDGSDPHSLNQRVLRAKSRNIAKRFIYAYLLGAGLGKLAQVLETSEDEARSALERLVERYRGLAYLKENIIPSDARRGWFVGLDGRRVAVPGETAGERKHLLMSGYLQNGEAIVMKRATLKWFDLLKSKNAMLVNLVHDEWQTEVPNNYELALEIAKIQADSLREVGEELKLKCPLAGSYWNDEHKTYTIGTNWSKTH